MGWEWHNRARNHKGKFDVLSEEHRKTEKLTIRLRPDQLERIRGRASGRFEDMTEYILGLVDADLKSAGLTGIGIETVRLRCTDTDGGFFDGRTLH